MRTVENIIASTSLNLQGKLIMKKTIEICMGSSCFARRNVKLVDLVKEFIAENNISNRVDLKGCLCLDQCKNGPNIKIDDTVFHKVDAITLIKILNDELL